MTINIILLVWRKKLVKVEEERDSLQLAIRLIAQDKYRQNEAATSASTINSESCNHKEWSKVHKSNNILGKTKVNQKQTIPVISSQNKFELLNEDINNSSGIEHNHEKNILNIITKALK